MISEQLRRARAYEARLGALVSPAERPLFHLTPTTGWLNDPNGLIYYKGKYHFFFQYNPYYGFWDYMHWGHAVSEDLLHWEYLPCALAPDEAYDRDGCFSGSAAMLPDGRQILMYTGVVRERRADGGCDEVQTQCLAVGDGEDYVKYENNPVLNWEDIPDGGSRFDFRDPKMWQEEDGTWRCVVGNRPADGSGQILLFESTDGFEWHYRKVLAENRNRFGRMWECPDFFPLDGKQVLLVSPQDMIPSGLEYHNGNGTLCLIGNYNRKTEEFTEEADQAVDYGIDFYAPQTVLTPDGRRVMIGWMQNWDTCNHRRVHDEAWFGQMSLPRELSIKNGKLYQTPVRELERMRHNKVSYENVTVSGILQLEGISGRRLDMELTVRPKAGCSLYRKFTVLFARNEQYHTSFSFRPAESVLKMDRKFSGTRRDILHERSSRVNGPEGELKLRIILDRFSVEAFVNDGEQVMTAVLYTDQKADGISFLSDGTMTMDVVKYDLI